MHFKWQLLKREFHCGKILRFQNKIPKSINDINSILTASEYTKEFEGERDHACISYDSNQLASNNPCEDARTEGSLIHTPGENFFIFFTCSALSV
jgi:hypothetical protein